MLRRDAGEITQLLNTILINVTHFFRDPAAWDFLRSEVLPPVLDEYRPATRSAPGVPGARAGKKPIRWRSV